MGLVAVSVFALTFFVVTRFRAWMRKTTIDRLNEAIARAKQENKDWWVAPTNRRLKLVE